MMSVRAGDEKGMEGVRRCAEKGGEDMEKPDVKDRTPRHTEYPHVKYGELIVLGYNGALPNGNKGRERSKFELIQRNTGNGILPVNIRDIVKDQESDMGEQKKKPSVSFLLNRDEADWIEFNYASDMDMFQIGRSGKSDIDFIVLDTIPGPRRTECTVTKSTISRYACRILVERDPPYVARIFAGGFDSSRKIYNEDKGIKWYSVGEIDGLTTNGILVQHPVGEFSSNGKPGVWHEVSVGGRLFELRESRSVQEKKNIIVGENNILKDGTLIDICGSTLVWRSTPGLRITQGKSNERETKERLTEEPVVLDMGSITTMKQKGKRPYVYLSCGHVFYFAGDLDSISENCAECKQSGPIVNLQMGAEKSLFLDSESLTHSFRPCGHLCSEKTIKYWSEVSIPRGTRAFVGACPFCASLLTGYPGWVKLIFPAAN